MMKVNTMNAQIVGGVKMFVKMCLRNFVYIFLLRNGIYNTKECANQCIGHTPCSKFSIDFVTNECILSIDTNASVQHSATATVWNVSL
jgi:hypothetical protein